MIVGNEADVDDAAVVGNEANDVAGNAADVVADAGSAGFRGSCCRCREIDLKTNKRYSLN